MFKVPGMVVHICNTSTQEADAGGSWVQGQPGLQRDPVAIQREQGRYLKESGYVIMQTDINSKLNIHINTRFNQHYS
jgi:hypothetical protein